MKVRLLHNPSFLTSLPSRLIVRYRHFDLPQQICYLLRLIPFTRPIGALLFRPLFSLRAQFKPGALLGINGQIETCKATVALCIALTNLAGIGILQQLAPTR